MLREKVLGGSLCAFAASMLLACPIKSEAPEDYPTLFEKIPQQNNQKEESEPDVIDLLKEKVRFTKNWDEGCRDTTLQISQEEATALMKIATAEAENQGVDGMLKVMEVVINRVNSPDYPNTIEGVIMQPHQFQPVEQGKYFTTEPSIESHLALAKLEMNIDPDTEIIAFEAAANEKSLEKYYAYAYTHKGHDFYVKN